MLIDKKLFKEIKKRFINTEFIMGIGKKVCFCVDKVKQRNYIKKYLFVTCIMVMLISVISAVTFVVVKPNAKKKSEYDAAMRLYDRNYAEAKKAFEKLGDYKDAMTMKEKAELKWRRKVANVESNFYYIGRNGDIKYLNHPIISDTLIENMEIGKHGRFVSVNYSCVAKMMDDMITYKVYEYVDGLYEDGRVLTAARVKTVDDENNTMEILRENTEIITDKGWQNIIQISALDDVIIALCHDGRVIHKKRSGEIEYDSEIWEEISKWKNVVEFKIDQKKIEAYAQNGKKYTLSIPGSEYIDVEEKEDYYVNEKKERIADEKIIYIGKNTILLEDGEIYKVYIEDGFNVAKKMNRKTVVYDEWKLR